MGVLYREGNSDFKFFGEWVFYPEGNEQAKKEAKDYLNLWRKFLIRKLSGELFDYEFIDEQWIDRESKYHGPLCTDASLAIKISYKKKLPGELA